MADSQGRRQRPHRKSRGGCARCKLRKVKCTETRPSCASCTRRNLPCVYTSEQAQDSDAPHSTEASEQQQDSPTPPYASTRSFDQLVSIESTERRLLEMRLLFHFISFTAKHDFLSSKDETVLKMWQYTAPSLAFEHPFLLNAIISIAALHTAKTSPERRDMAEAHRTYFNTAISQHRDAVRDLSAANAEAVCLSTVLISLPAFILLQNTEVGSYSPPLQLFRLQAGTVNLFQTAFPLVPCTSEVNAIMTAAPIIEAFKNESKRDIYRVPFTNLVSWRAADEMVSAESQEAFSVALGFIGYILTAIESGQHDVFHIRRLLYSVPTIIPPIFVKRLQDKDPRALTILSYYFSLFKAADGIWWMRGIAEREVLGIQSILPEQWQWAVAWSLQKLASFAASTLPGISTRETLEKRRGA